WEGRALLERVGLGLELRVRAEPEERGESSVTFPGPTTSEQRLAVRLEVGAALPVLLGRILGPGRKPIAGAALRLEALVGPGPRTLTSSTDRDGRFRCPVRDLDSIREASELRLVARRPRGEAFDGRIEEPHLGPGVTDLGDVVLSAAPLLVR